MIFNVLYENEGENIQLSSSFSAQVEQNISRL